MAAVSDAGLVAALSDLAQSDISDHWIHHRRPKEDDSVRPAAVLMLFGRGIQPRTEAGLREQDRLGDFGDVDVVLLKRADTLRNHPGQVAFPGGRRDPEDATAVDAALRETREETGVDPARVNVIGTWPSLWVPVSRHSVTPVIATWDGRQVLQAVDRAESSSVHRVPVADLVAPANRGVFKVPKTGWHSPVFDAGVLRSWGFTAGLLDSAFEALGWSREWDRTNRLHIDI